MIKEIETDVSSSICIQAPYYRNVRKQSKTKAFVHICSYSKYAFKTLKYQEECSTGVRVGLHILVELYMLRLGEISAVL